ncbi:MAG: hypothetical protein NTV77_00605 [Candidatus Azambacteria bacterium]|nr:hypothetical protein [Candidatus Azambacteria bacterium]
MLVELKPNRKLFTIFLIINAAGYDYENNPNGVHPLRIDFRNKTANLILKNEIFSDIVATIKKIPLPSDDYVCLANFIMMPKLARNSNKDKTDKLVSVHLKKLLEQFNKIIKSPIINQLFNKYCRTLSNIPNYSKSNFSSHLCPVLDFFHLRPSIIRRIKIHLNLLESCSRGTNYYMSESGYISVSLDLQNHISWPTVRHEFMHILLKKIIRLEGSIENKLAIAVDKNYQDASPRVKFDENFVLAANLFFIGDENKRKNNLKYFYDKGFYNIYTFYKFIETNFAKSNKKLSNRIISELVKEFVK